MKTIENQQIKSPHLGLCWL